MAESQDHAPFFEFLSKILPAAQLLNKKHGPRVRLFRFWRLTPLAGTSNVSQTQQKGTQHGRASGHREKKAHGPVTETLR